MPCWGLHPKYKHYSTFNLHPSTGLLHNRREYCGIRLSHGLTMLRENSALPSAVAAAGSLITQPRPSGLTPCALRVHMSRLACGVQNPGLSPSALFSSVFFNQLAANLKNATNLLTQLKAENASLVVNTNGPRKAPAPVTQKCLRVFADSSIISLGQAVDCDGGYKLHNNMSEDTWDILLSATFLKSCMLSGHVHPVQRTTCQTWHRSSMCTRPSCRTPAS